METPNTVLPSVTGILFLDGPLPPVFSKGSCEVKLRALLPTAGASIGYRQRRSTVRSIAKRYDVIEISEFFEFSMSALFYCHVDYIALSGYYMLDYVTAIISQYAPAISLKDLFCASLLCPRDPLALDHAKFYAAFERFASIGTITCSSCAVEIENELRNLCTAKQITFATL